MNSTAHKATVHRYTLECKTNIFERKHVSSKIQNNMKNYGKNKENKTEYEEGLLLVHSRQKLIY